MKTITIKNPKADLVVGKLTHSPDSKGFKEIVVEGPEEMDASDGYHTFTELYDHRITLFIAYCRLWKLVDRTFPRTKVRPGQEDKNPQDVTIEFTPPWRSKRHSDGELCFGTGTQYILGIGTEKGKQISYHIPVERWDETDFAETLEKAPEWDGHTSADVITRLKNL